MDKKALYGIYFLLFLKLLIQIDQKQLQKWFDYQ